MPTVENPNSLFALYSSSNASDNLFYVDILSLNDDDDDFLFVVQVMEWMSGRWKWTKSTLSLM